MRSLQEIEADADKLTKEIEDVIDSNGSMHAFGPLAYFAVLDARPELKARADALEREYNEATKQ